MDYCAAMKNDDAVSSNAATGVAAVLQDAQEAEQFIPRGSKENPRDE